MKRSATLLGWMVLCFLLAGCGGGPPDASDPAEMGPQDSPEHTYSCGSGATFTAEDIAAERPPSQEVLGALEQLRQTMDGAFLPEDGWIEIDATGSQVTMIAPLGDAYASATFEDQQGEWDPSGWGDCVPRLQVSGRSVLRWAFTEDSYPFSPDATELEVLVSEVDCSSGRDIDGLIESTIAYEQEKISAILTAPGLSGDQTCPGNPPTKYTISLDEPPGQRAIVDPSVYPAVEPTPGTRLP